MQFGALLSNAYSINIVTDVGQIKKMYQSGYNYYPMMSDQAYSIKLSNSNPSRCDAYVYLGGRSLGIYRIQPFSSIVIPSTSSKRLVFTIANSFTNKWSTVDCDTSSAGLIKVVFNPESSACGSYGCGHNCNCDNFQNKNCCLFGSNNTDEMNESYLMSLTGRREMAISGQKMVPLLKDIDSSRKMVVEARLISRQ